MIFKNFLMFASRNAVPRFTMEVKSDNIGASTDSQFTIPTTVGTYLYDYTTSDGQSGTGITGDETITFASGPGTYEIYITGTFPNIYFSGAGDPQKLLRILEWGDYGIGVTNISGAFINCINLTSIASDVTNLNLATTAQFAFRNCPALSSLPDALTFPVLEDGFRMFRDCGITSLPSGMTLPALSSGSQMFLGVTLDTTRYSQLLVDLESGNPNNSVVFEGGNSKYNATGETARNILTGGVRLWTITDGGLEP